MAEDLKNVVDYFSKKIYTDLTNHSEIPDWVTMYPQRSTIGFQQHFDAVAFPTDVYSPWFRGKKAFWDQARIIQRSLSYNRSVNIVEMFQSEGDTCLPLLLEFLWADQLESYISMMTTPHLNRLLTDKLKTVLSQFTDKHVDFQSLSTNPTFDIFNSQVETFMKKHQKEGSVNIFVLATSVMSNFMDNDVVLSRMNQAMKEDDYLLVSQAMFKDGTEEELLKQYREFFLNPDSAPTSRQLTEMIETDYQYHVDWQEHEHYRGPTLYFNVERSTGTSFVQADLKPKQQITLFHSHRFTMMEIISLFERNSFRVESLFVEEMEDNAVFLLRKKRSS